MSEARTPAEIEASIVRKRQDLAATLDEIAVRVHPGTIAGDMRARALEAVDHTAARAYASAHRALSDLRGPWVAEDGTPRLKRIVPVAVVGLAVIGAIAVSTRRRRRG